MKRTALQPIRIRRVLPSAAISSPAALRASAAPTLSLGTRRTIAAIGALWLAVAATSHAAAPAEAAPAPTVVQKSDPLVARGRYLVEHVSLCADCHSPRNEKGEFVRTLWQKGAPLGFQPAMPMPWAPAAPMIAGLPTMTEAQGVVFFQTGKRPDGSAPLPPMPEYRFSAEDASAVVAYLKSLAP